MGSYLLTAVHAGSRAHDGPASERVSSCMTVAIERGNAGRHSGERVHSKEEARVSDLLTITNMPIRAPRASRGGAYCMVRPRCGRATLEGKSMISASRS